MRIADDIGTPKAESPKEWQRLVKNATGNYVNKDIASKIDDVIRSTPANSQDRSEAIRFILSYGNIRNEDIKIIASLLSPYE